MIALLVAGVVSAQQKEGPERAEPSAVEVKVAGADLSFVPVDISSRRRNARSEAGLLKKATAVLTTSRASSYRRKRLQPGDYRLTLESEDAKSWFLLLWPEDTKSADGEKSTSKKSKEGTKSKEDKSRDAVRPALRIPLSLATMPTEDHRVVFELKLLDKGKRLRITVRAGSTQLSGVLRWEEPPRE